MMRKSRIDDTFESFRNEIKIGDRSVTRKVIRRERILFEKRSNNGLFKVIRENTFRKGKIDKSCYR